MKIKLMRNIDSNFNFVEKCDKEGRSNLDDHEDYCVLSEVIDVDFPMLPDVDINGAKVKVIDEKIKKALAVLEALEQQKAELLAIPDMTGK